MAARVGCRCRRLFQKASQAREWHVAATRASARAPPAIPHGRVEDGGTLHNHAPHHYGNTPVIAASATPSYLSTPRWWRNNARSPESGNRWHVLGARITLRRRTPLTDGQWWQPPHAHPHAAPAISLGAHAPSDTRCRRYPVRPVGAPTRRVQRAGFEREFESLADGRMMYRTAADTANRQCRDCSRCSADTAAALSAQTVA